MAQLIRPRTLNREVSCSSPFGEGLKALVPWLLLAYKQLALLVVR